MSESDVVIRVEGLGKKYALHHEKAERYTALRDVVARQARAAGRLLNPFTLAGQLHKARNQALQERSEGEERNDREEEFWALKDVSFEIRRGERVGIIGRNGAGKSTLLKILSRITEPTTGRVEIRGRVASLLEVGTGFHPELTGRENIYLNGAILGMSRREIRSKFDEIVDFAEVERFLDTPVKRYSSGMYVRLAFAVAAHLEPEILVVDEVLAVGDASFQKKCLGKMEDVTDREGRTVLFVSHQMPIIQALCQSGLLLAEGHVSFLGPIRETVKNYQANNAETSREIKLSGLPRSGSLEAQFVDVFLVDDNGERCSTVQVGEALKICFHLRANTEIRGLSIGYSIHDNTDQTLSLVYSGYDNQFFSIEDNPLDCTIISTVNDLPLSPGKYSIRVRMTRFEMEIDWPRGSVLDFNVAESSYYENQGIIAGKHSLLCTKPLWTTIMKGK